MSGPLADGTYYIVYQQDQPNELYADLDKSPDDGDITGARIIIKKADKESITQKFVIEESENLPGSYNIRPAAKDNLFFAPTLPWSGGVVQLMGRPFPWKILPVSSSSRKGFDGSQYNIEPIVFPERPRTFWSLVSGQEGDKFILQHIQIAMLSFIPVKDDGDESD